MTSGIFAREFPEEALKCRKINQSAFSIFIATSIDNSFIIASHIFEMRRLTVA
jgi:hypothetical protein